MTTIDDQIARAEERLERLRELKARPKRPRGPPPSPEITEALKGAAAAYLDGASVTDIALTTGVDPGCIYARFRRAGVKLRGAHDRPKCAARRAAIVAARREGRGLADIGLEFGITRERVRQIITTAGDPSLLGRVRSQRLPRAACVVCGKPCEGLHAKTCSIECRAVAARGTSRNRRPDWRTNYERAKAMRAEGRTWGAIANTLGIGQGCACPASKACAVFARWERCAASDSGGAA